MSNSGVDIYGYRNPSLHSFYISLFVRAGCMYESYGQNGITHFLEHAAIRNVNSLMGGELYSELDRRGIEFNASTYSEMIQFYVSGAREHIAFASELICKILSPIVLSSSEMNAERKRIKAEIRESDDKNTLTQFTNEKVFFETSLASSIVGTNSSVDKISARRLEEYRRSVFTSDNIFFYLTGNFDSSDVSHLMSVVDSYCLERGKFNDNIAPVPQNFGKRNGEVFVKNADFTMIRFTFDLDMSSLGVPVVDLLYDILLSGYNSRLFIEMSERRGLFYDISGGVERYKNIGTLNFSYEVKEREIYSSVELVLSILSEIKQRCLSEAECMKAGYVDNALMLYDDPRELNFSFAYDNHVMGLGYASLDARRNTYAALTPEDVRNAAAEIFRFENLTVTVKGNKRRIDVEKIKNIILEVL